MDAVSHRETAAQKQVLQKRVPETPPVGKPVLAPTPGNRMVGEVKWRTMDAVCRDASRYVVLRLLDLSSRLSVLQCGLFP